MADEEFDVKKIGPNQFQFVRKTKKKSRLADVIGLALIAIAVLAGMRGCGDTEKATPQGPAVSPASHP